MAPAPPLSSCTVCGAPIASGSDRCGRCGAVFGDFRRCDGCGARAEVVHKGGMVYVCAACGRPRVPMERPGIVRSGRERPALLRAGDYRRDAALSKVVGVTGGSIAALLVLGALLMLAFGLKLVFLFLLGLSIFVAAMGALGLRNATKSQKLADAAMRDALTSVAMDVLRARGPTTAPELAAQLGITEEVADKVLMQLPAQAQLRVETMVDERATDGLLRYRIADGGLSPQAGMNEEDAERAAFDAKLAAAMHAKGLR